VSSWKGIGRLRGEDEVSWGGTRRVVARGVKWTVQGRRGARGKNSKQGRFETAEGKSRLEDKL